MDTLTSRHGLSVFKSPKQDDEVDLSSLSSELKEELNRLEKEFTVDQAKLKEISKAFEQELQDGMGTNSRRLLGKAS